MVKLVSAGRADFLLAPFQSGKDMALYAFDKKLVPVPGWQLALKGERVYGLSRKTPHARQIKDALYRGMRKLRLQDVIRDAYQAAGMYPQKTRDWTIIANGQVL